MFMNDSTEVGRILNDLVQACNDSALRFHHAVGRVEKEELRRMTERETFALRLRQHVELRDAERSRAHDGRERGRILRGGRLRGIQFASVYGLAVPLRSHWPANGAKHAKKRKSSITDRERRLEIDQKIQD